METPSVGTTITKGTEKSEETKGDALKPFKKDSWRNETSCWIRECRRNRRALFTPIGTKDGPYIYISLLVKE